MGKVMLYITMSLDGYIAGPNNELVWMQQPPDQEMNDDTVALISSADTGIIGYPTAVGMVPYWASVPHNPSASKEEQAIAAAVNKSHSIILSNTEENLAWTNSELLLVKSDQELVEAVNKLKKLPGRVFGVPGGVRTAQKFTRLGLVDEYELMVQPVAIGSGKSLFTTKVNLKLVGAKMYGNGMLRLSYHAL